MSELHIRINKRAVERAIFLVAIIVLATLLFLKWDAPTVDMTQVTSLEQENEQLTTQVATLQEQVAALEAAQQELQAPEPEPEAEPETEPEPELSGDIEATWSVTMDGDRLERVTLVIENGRDRSEDVSYNLFWQGFYPETIFDRGTVYVASGATQTVILESGGDGVTPRPPESTTTLILRITDSSDNLVDELREVVR